MLILNAQLRKANTLSLLLMRCPVRFLAVSPLLSRTTHRPYRFWTFFSQVFHLSPGLLCQRGCLGLRHLEGRLHAKPPPLPSQGDHLVNSLTGSQCRVYLRAHICHDTPDDLLRRFNESNMLCFVMITNDTFLNISGCENREEGLSEANN